MVQEILQYCQEAKLVFCKFLSANDTGETNAHQSGIYIPKQARSILFDTPGQRGENKDRFVKISWADGSEKEVRFIYYGVGTRNEYRITRFGKGFEFLRPKYTGALFVLLQMDDDDYKGYFLNTENEIDAFLEALNISPVDTNAIIPVKHTESLDQHEERVIQQFISQTTEEFPASEQMSLAARKIEELVYDHSEKMITDPDLKLVNWTNEEYRLFRAFETARYMPEISSGFSDVASFVELANKVLNRRKSRAGKSLEHHLAALFDANKLQYTPQAKTEGNKKPDFIFPSEEAYHNSQFPVEGLISLAAKTTCKDRWRQILNESNRLRGRNKYLCTLQQGISSAQLQEMHAEKVILVVPKMYIKTYPAQEQQRIWTVSKFIQFVREQEAQL